MYHSMKKQSKLKSIAKKKEDNKNFKTHMMYKDGKVMKVTSFKMHKDLMSKGWSHKK